MTHSSSIPKSKLIPPASLITMEDVIATDGRGGLEYCEVLMRRYRSSEPFRRMLRQMDWFWGLEGAMMAVWLRWWRFSILVRLLLLLVN
jgi:hypothetical protein